MAIEEVTYGREANDICSQTEKQRANGRCALCTDPAVYPWTNPISCFFIAPRLPFVQYPAHLFLFHSCGFASTCSVPTCFMVFGARYGSLSQRRCAFCTSASSDGLISLYCNVGYFSIQLTVTYFDLEWTRFMQEAFKQFMTGYFNITTYCT